MSTPAAQTPAAPAALAATQTPAAPPASAAAPTTQAPANNTPATPPEPPKQNGNSIAQYAIKERKLQNELKAERERNAALAARASILDQLKDPKTRAAAYKALEDAGLDFDDLTEHKIKTFGGKKDAPAIELPDDVKEKLAKIEALEKRAQDADRAEQEAAQQKATEQAHAEAETFVKQHAEKLPLISSTPGAHVALLKAFQQEVQKNEGIAPDAVKFAQEFEAKYEVLITRNLKELASTSKGRALIAAQLASHASPPTTGDSTKGGAPARLSNDLSAEPGAPIDVKTLSEHELRKRASTALQ